MLVRDNMYALGNALARGARARASGSAAIAFVTPRYAEDDHHLR